MKKCIYCHERIADGTKVCPVCQMPQGEIVHAAIETPETAKLSFSGGETFDAALSHTCLSVAAS